MIKQQRCMTNYNRVPRHMGRMAALHPAALLLATQEGTETHDYQLLSKRVNTTLLCSGRLSLAPQTGDASVVTSSS
jgi:hypothetical protein